MASSKELSQEAVTKVKELIGRYPDKRSVVMPALYIAQEELGYINDEAVQWVSEQIDLAPVHVMEVATFYTMYYKKPVGRYHFQVCRTLSCALLGAKKISEYLHDKFGIEPNEVSADGMWSYEEVECLGSCGTAPMCQVNDIFAENLTVEKLEKLIADIERAKPDMRFSAKTERLGEGLSDYPKSEVA